MSASVMVMCEVISLLNSFSTVRSRRICAFRSSMVIFFCVELALKFLLGVGRLQLVDLRVDVGIHRHQPQLLGALQHDFVVDQAAQHFQLLRHHLVVVGVLGIRGGLLRLVRFVQFRVRNRTVVYHRRHIGGRRFAATGGQQDQRRCCRGCHQRLRCCHGILILAEYGKRRGDGCYKAIRIREPATG